MHINDKNCDICQVAATFAKMRKRFVPWCVNKKKTWNNEFHSYFFEEFATGSMNSFLGNNACADCLSDCSCFTINNSGISDSIKEFRFPVVNVPENRDEWFADHRREKCEDVFKCLSDQCPLYSKRPKLY